MATDAFVEVQHHADLCAYFHGSAPSVGVTRLSCPTRRSVQPVDLVHLAHHHELVAVGAYRAVIVEAVTQLRIAAYHVRGLEHDARHRVMDAAARAGDHRSRRVDDLFLRVVHQHHAGVDALADHRARRDRAIDVEYIHPVVVDNAGTLSVVFAAARRSARRGSA